MRKDIHRERGRQKQRHTEGENKERDREDSQKSNKEAGNESKWGHMATDKKNNMHEIMKMLTRVWIAKCA